jgi:hypothetical protein
MRWRLIIEEFGPEFNYIKGPKNIVADALSRLSLLDPEPKQGIKAIAEYYGIQTDDIILTFKNNNLQILHYNKLLVCLLIIICTPFVGRRST